jgi:hypothetical protein
MQLMCLQRTAITAKCSDHHYVNTNFHLNWCARYQPEYMAELTEEEEAALVEYAYFRS